MSAELMKSTRTKTKTEAEDLNLHVQLCAERYNTLEGKIHAMETKLSSLESKVGDLSKTLQSNFLEIKLSLEKANSRRDVQVIATLGAIAIAVISAGAVWLNK